MTLDLPSHAQRFKFHTHNAHSGHMATFVTTFNIFLCAPHTFFTVAYYVVQYVHCLDARLPYNKCANNPKRPASKCSSTILVKESDTET